MCDIPNSIKLKIGADRVSDVKFHPTKNTLVIGTVEGRVRIYDCDKKNPSELFRKQWHKNLTKISISPSGSKILTSSNQGCIKEHDFETGKSTWTNLLSHENDISALIYQTENLFISGDTQGILKYWDSRQKDEVCQLSLCDIDEDCEEDNKSMLALYANYLSSINDLVLEEHNRYLFAAMDDGTLVTVNNRKRKLELRSETLGYSAKSIVTLKNQSKLGVATDEGVVTIFNWDQFGNLSDRFPVIKNDIELEKMIKINENVVVIGTNTGVIKAASVLPNLVLTDIGVHQFPKGDEDCGDCIALDVNFDKSIIASGCPGSDFVCFFSPQVANDQFVAELNDRSMNKRKKERTVFEVRKKRRLNDDKGFLDGFFESENKEDEETDGEEEIESLDSDDDDSDSD